MIEIVWFCLVAIMIAGYVVLDGFDLGAGIIHLFVARTEQERTIQAQPNHGPALCLLGLIDAALGRKEEALREGRRAAELLPVERDSVNGLDMIEYLAMIAAWVGEEDLACEQLAKAVRYPMYPSAVSYGELKLMPWWDALRGQPCFEKIVASLAPKQN